MFDIYAGVDLAFGKLTHYYKYESVVSSYDMEYTKDQNLKDTNLGSRFGIICSAQLNKFITLGIEVSGGSTKFDSWSGEREDTFKWNYPGDTGSSTESHEGQLWAYKGINQDGLEFPGLAVLESKPGGALTDVHPVLVKFSRYGIKINLSFNLKQIFD